MFFVKIYRFFNKHKILMYSILLLSSIVFVYFGLKLQYEEDLSNLLPSSKSKESGLVFGNLKVKDKIFIQMQGESPQTMIQYIDELMDSIIAKYNAFVDKYNSSSFFASTFAMGLCTRPWKSMAMPKYLPQASRMAATRSRTASTLS